jgi:hypothetical protein
MKKRSRRMSNFSVKWSRLVYSHTNIESPSKKQKKALQRLWFEGYSHKDAADWLNENMPQEWSDDPHQGA